MRHFICAYRPPDIMLSMLMSDIKWSRRVQLQGEALSDKLTSFWQVDIFKVLRKLPEDNLEKIDQHGTP